MPLSIHAALIGSIIASAAGALVMCLLVFAYGLCPREKPAKAGRELLAARLGHAAAGACFAITAILSVVVLAQHARATAPPPAPEPGAVAHAGHEHLDAVRSRVEGAEVRLQRAEARLAAVERTVRQVGDDASQAVMRARQAERAALLARRSAAPPPPAVRAAPPAARPEPLPAARPAADQTVSRPVVEPPPIAEYPPAEPPPVVTGLPARSPAPPSVAPAPPSRPALASEPYATPPPRAPGDLRSKLREDWDVVKQGFRSAGDDFRRMLREVKRNLAP